MPLKVASYIGFATALVGVRLRRLLHRQDAGPSAIPFAGFPTLVALVLFLGGLQLMALGIIGEYLARMFIEVKQRPLYLVAAAPAAVATASPAPTASDKRREPETWPSS